MWVSIICPQVRSLFTAIRELDTAHRGNWNSTEFCLKCPWWRDSARYLGHILYTLHSLPSGGPRHCVLSGRVPFDRKPSVGINGWEWTVGPRTKSLRGWRKVRMGSTESPLDSTRPLAVRSFQFRSRDRPCTRERKTRTGKRLSFAQD